MLKQTFSQKLLQKLSPQQIQLMKLIQLPTAALEQRIKEEMEVNPALEEGAEVSESTDEYDDFNEGDNERIEADDINIDEYLSDDEIPSYRLNTNNYSADDEESQVPYSGGATFHELLMQQLDLRIMSDDDRVIAEYLIGSIDDDGYIRREFSAIVDDLAFSQNISTSEEQLEKLIEVIQDFDPPGVGARDLKECLTLQLENKEHSPSVLLAINLLENYFDEFTKKHYKKLVEKLGINEDELKDAVEEISKLNPKPGNSVAGNTRVAEHVVPDFILRIVDGELELSLNARNAPELNVSRSYKDMLETYKNSKENSKAEKEAVLFVKQKLDSAKWFIEAIRQRQHTLMITMSSIMNYQKEYFLTGDERKLKPMILKDIADEIEMDISTVSRVASSKYVLSPYGTHLVKSFFSEAMKNDQGEDVSTKEIKKILEDSIGEEDKRKPLTDDKLAKLLKDKGYPIARRTVAKYREQLNIPVARLRKEL